MNRFTQIKKALFLSLLLSICTLTSSYGQTASEALRYSQNIYGGGTARVVGTAGAYGAIGADFGGLSINPAGLGLYRNSEWSFTPSLQMANNESNYLNNLSNESALRFTLTNVGWVSNVARPRKGRTKGLVSASYAIGINRLSSFIDQNYIEGINTEPNKSYINNIGYGTFAGNSPIRQRENSFITGGMNEAIFALGFNHSNTFYFGAQLGIPYFVYKDDYNYVEDDYNGQINEFDRYDLETTLKTTGVGVNGKFGVIYRPDDAYRFGLAFHTPSLFEMNDEYTGYETIIVDNENGAITEETLDNYEGNFAYALKTPSKWVASAAFFPARKGFISVDYELVNYAKARFDNSFDDTNIDNQGFFSDVNREINLDYRAASNIKIGVEYAPEMLRLRAGYAFMGSPIEDKEFRAPNHVVSLGGGVRFKRMLLDLAYTNTFKKYDYTLYTNANATEIKNRKSQVLLTLGFRM